jgi:putative ABC transport system permease protein
MTVWSKWWDRRRNDLGEELEAHLRMAVTDRVSRGERPEEARANTMHELGNVPLIADVTRTKWGWLRLENVGKNIRYALRQLRRSPAFALTAILALALGIGPNVAIFSMIWATFLAPPPYPNANQLVVVWDHYKGERMPTRGEDYAQYAAQSHSFQSLSFQSWVVLHLTNPDHTPNEEGGLPITPGLNTRTVREPMLLGRDFLPDEGGPSTDHVVILSHWLWQNHYSSDPKILGKSILIEDEPYTVVGVMRAGPHEEGGGVEFTVPVLLAPGEHSKHFGVVIGRLKPGVTLAEAQAELSVIHETIARQRNSGQETSSRTLTVEHFRNDWLDLKTQRNLWLLLDAVSLVLLIACANLANLLLARGNARSQEIAVRSALGATRAQIFVQLLTESLTLAAIGGAIGIAMGWVLVKLSVALLPNLAIESSDTLVQINLPVLGFAIVIALLAGVVAGCTPSFRSAWVNQSEALKQGTRTTGSRGRAPLQAVLVSAEIALALILLAGSGMALHSFWNLSHIDVGFQADHVMTAELSPRHNAARGGKYSPPAPEQVVVQQRQLLDHVRGIPGVADAALGTGMPMHGFDTFPFAVAGQPVDTSHLPTADFEAVTPSYFTTFRIRLARGRFLNDNDGLQSPPVVMVNETFVHRYLPSDDPLTHRLLLGLPFIRDKRATANMPAPLTYQIVGVFHDVLDNEQLTGAVQPEMYVSQWQAVSRWVEIAVRTLGIDPATITTPLQSAVSSVEAGTGIDHVETMTQVVDGQRSSDRFEMILFGGFAAVALLLATIGIYGVMSFAVTQRRHEIGVRMALGARRSDVIRLIMASGLRMALAGLGIGLTGAIALGRLMHSTLYGVQIADLSSLTAVAVLFLAVALLACWVPARRSAAIDPMQALRNE